MPDVDFSNSTTADDGAVASLDSAPEFAELASPSAATPAAVRIPEITVIVDSRDGSGRKEMIVIKRPSPYLMQLLTGQGPEDQQLASARKVILSTTGARQALRTRKSVASRP